MASNIDYGFYNGEDREYDALDVSQIFDGVFEDGVFDKYMGGLKVVASELDDVIIVSPGRAWFDHTWNYNPISLSLGCELAPPLGYRYDAVVLDINSDVSVRENNIIYVTGTNYDIEKVIAYEYKPTMINTSTHHQYPLAYVCRVANQNTIKTDDIENTIGTDECPCAKGVLHNETNVKVDSWDEANQVLHLVSL